LEHSQEVSSSRARYRSSFLSGTCSEFIGAKPLPVLLKERPIVFILGPSGVGKSMVARRILGEETTFLRQQEFLDSLALRILLHKWPDTLIEPDKLIVEGPCFLQSRPTVLLAFTQLITARVERGLQTIILDAEDHGPLQELLSIVPIEQRMTLLLRFPSGRGRYRFLAHACRARQLPLSQARRLAKVEPWTYAIVLDELDRLVQDKAEESSGSSEAEKKALEHALISERGFIF
jgi:hypothetical protein